MATNLAELEKPSGLSSGTAEPVIHVIPKEFYGAAVPAKRPVPVAAPAPVAPPPPRAPSAKEGHGGLIAVIVILAVLLLGGAGASYYFLIMKKPVAPKPAAVVCGDNACGAGESFASCPADCPAPPPTCGDTKCEGSETYAACPADCPAPPPTCGDSKCEGSENFTSCPNDCPAPPPVCGDGQCEEGKEDLKSCPGDCRPPVPIAGQDIDSDGLTDLEEVQVYGSDSRNSDTDSDSYVDLNELVNLYNPSKPFPSLLKENLGVTSFDNAKQKYAAFRPTNWTMREGDDVLSDVFFTAPDGEAIEIAVQPKPADKSLMEWYLGQAPGMKSEEISTFKTRQGHEALQTPDRLTSYINVGNRVIALIYHLGDDRLMQYRATFLMMVQSVKAQSVSEVVVPKVVPEAPAVPAEAAAETPASVPATAPATAPATSPTP